MREHKKGHGSLPALESDKFADSPNTPDYGFVQGQSGRCFNCCALCQALYYLGQTSNSGNPSDEETYGRMLEQQKELAGTILALMDRSMLNSTVTGNLVSPDEDMRGWMVVAYSSVRGARTEKEMSNWGVRGPSCHCHAGKRRIFVRDDGRQHL